ncbi:MAG: hypothetical protein F4145_08175 [Boseongicola sp. SB0675_bin_26]|nr:hypothetical protein [Boseongicola sp. SB0675_bin_26]
MGRELDRQRDEIELIASENIVSQAIQDAAGSVLTDKCAEGYPGRRYSGGCKFVDKAESLAIERAKALFDCGFAARQSDCHRIDSIPGPGGSPNVCKRSRIEQGSLQSRARQPDLDDQPDESAGRPTSRRSTRMPRTPHHRGHFEEMHVDMVPASFRPRFSAAP